MNRNTFFMLSALLLCISQVKSYTYQTADSTQELAPYAPEGDDASYFDAARESLTLAGLEPRQDIFQKLLDSYESDSKAGKPLNERRRIIIIIIIIIRIEIRRR